jgi:hypothetical protein
MGAAFGDENSWPPYMGDVPLFGIRFWKRVWWRRVWGKGGEEKLKEFSNAGIRSMKSGYQCQQYVWIFFVEPFGEGVYTAPIRMIVCAPSCHWLMAARLLIRERL